MEAGPLNLDAIEARANAATPGPWTPPTQRERGPGCDDRACVVDHEGCAVWPWRRREDMEFAYAARTDVPALIARVRELEAGQRAASNLLAIIHGDGGHYEDAHGTAKACKDAEGVVSDLRLKLDAATYARQTGCQCQWEAGDSPCKVHGDDDK